MFHQPVLPVDASSVRVDTSSVRVDASSVRVDTSPDHGDVLSARSDMLLSIYSVRKQVVNVPSYIVRLDSQKHIDFSLSSPHGCGRPGEWRPIEYRMMCWFWAVALSSQIV